MLARLRRTMLYVPGNNPAMVRDAQIYGSDSLMFDLEDSVSPREKDAARLLVFNALRALDYGSLELVVRVNALDGPFGREDLRAMVLAGIEVVRLPKAESAEDIALAERLLAEEEARAGRTLGEVRLMAAVETALGVVNVFDIARASKRLVGIAIGAEDLVTDLKTVRSPEGVEILEARSRVVLAARAAGIMAFDTVYSDVRNEEGFRAEVRLAKQLGFDGKSVINPNQIGIVHEIYAPTPEEIDRARRVLEAAGAAEERGSGVVSLDGKMIDKPIVERARRILDLAEASGPGGSGAAARKEGR